MAGKSKWHYSCYVVILIMASKGLDIPIPRRVAALLVVIFGYLSHVTDGRFLALRPGPWTSVGLRFPNMRDRPNRDLWPKTAVNTRKVGKNSITYQCTKYSINPITYPLGCP